MDFLQAETNGCTDQCMVGVVGAPRVYATGQLSEKTDSRKLYQLLKEASRSETHASDTR